MKAYPKILKWNGKHGDVLILVASQEDEPAAWLAMFKAIDQWSGFYKQYLPDDQKELYQSASGGNWLAARNLIYARELYEYEGVELENVYTPEQLAMLLD